MAKRGWCSSTTPGRTLVDIVRSRAQQRPDGIAYTFVTEHGAENHLTYADLDAAARAIGADIRSRIGPASRVVLLYPSDLEFVKAFYGCLYGGVVAVPAYPIEAGNAARGVARLKGIACDAGARIGLTSRACLRDVQREIAGHPDLRLEWVAIDDIPLERSGEWTDPNSADDDLAIVQYTSGSTAEPKGVMVSHGNIMANQAMILRAHRHDETTTFVGWIPLAHDWGLMNNVIQAAYVGARSVLMGTDAFVRRPRFWLETISRYTNVHSGGPGFAYDLCVSRVTDQQRDGLNLFGWKGAGLGAGPVRVSTLQRFAEAFGPLGFRTEAFYSGYGLSEATLLVSQTDRRRAPRVLCVARRRLERNEVDVSPPPDVPAAELVSCGEPSPDTQVLIVDPETDASCPPDRVGEILVRGPGVCRGYLNNTAETARTLVYRDGVGPFVKTGDLGFVVDGELFVTGRLKDLIIVRGRNVYPQDVERAIESSHQALRKGCGVAFSVDGPTEEELVIVHEIRTGGEEDADAIIAAIRASAAEHVGIDAHAVLLVRAGTIAKTSSGKLQRVLCRARYLAGELSVVARSGSDASRGKTDRVPVGAPRSPTEERLIDIWSDVFYVSGIGIHDNFIALGGHSLLAAQCAARILDELGVEVSMGLFFSEHGTIAELSSEIDRMRQPAHSPAIAMEFARTRRAPSAPE
jgi:acyl-CoA synthetase (AMP-forming)/AMP-acid ligase II